MQWIIPIKYIYVCYSKIGFIAFLIEQFRIRSYFIQLVLQHQTVPEILKLVGEILYLLAEPDLLETDIDSFPVNILLVFKTSETRFRDTS